jgi:glycosyltransferase involved in cell wall biosynthesis
LDHKRDKKLTIIVANLCSILSKYIPAKIICCSNKTKKLHEKIGYEKGKLIVIPNGFDLIEFMPNPKAYENIRNELKIKSETKLIGLIGRYHTQKGHDIFLKAGIKIIESYKRVHLLLCGQNVCWENKKIAEIPQVLKYKDKIHLLGLRNDMPDIMSSLDICCLSSHGEAFPLVVGEAMASGVPCVVTNVGDSAEIVANTGIVVPSGNERALYLGIKKLLEKTNKERQRMGIEARKRIKNEYNIDKISEKYEMVYHNILGKDIEKIDNQLLFRNSSRFV